MGHAPPFDAVRRTLEISTSKGVLRVGASYDVFLDIVRRFIGLLPVDETWYLDTYPDVTRAIARGAVASARQHFVENGYFEGRLPSAPDIDETWYLRENADVADGVESGRIPSATHHFVHDGYKEGRRAHP